MEQRDEKYGERNFLHELEVYGTKMKSGYITKKDAEHYRWLFKTALSWIRGTNGIFQTKICVCDSCKTWLYIPWGYKYNFCPECGEKLKGESDG